MNPKKFIVLLMLLSGIFGYAQQSNVLWYTKPATKWDAEGLPIGNGRMGAMMMGGINKDIIQFNEQSLWSGDSNWDGAYETGDHGFWVLPQFRKYRS
jgi:alpha-L-fucosidase 2